MEDFNKMKRKEFESLPRRSSWLEEVMADFLIILPTRRLHDSNFRCMDIVAVSEKGMIRVAGGSDVMHIDGIGGFGDNWLEKYGTCPASVHPIGWSIDCLKTSGLLRIWANGYQIKCGPSMSSFEMFSVPRKEELERREKFEVAGKK